jgi:hypothetical protein
MEQLWSVEESFYIKNKVQEVVQDCFRHISQECMNRVAKI